MGGQQGMRISYRYIEKRTGADIYFRRAADGMRGRGHEVTLVTYPSLSEYWPLFLQFPGSWPAEGDIVHSNLDYSYALATEEISLISTALHIDFGLVGSVYHSPLVNAWRRVLRKRLARGLRVSDEVITISKSTREILEREFGYSDAKVVYPGIEVQDFRPMGTRKVRDAFTILFVGKLSRRKGADLLPAIMRSLGEKCLAIVVGRRSNDVTLTRLPRTKFYHDVTRDRLIDLYNLANVVIVPSRLEGFGYVAVEAMACGTPIVGFSCPGLSETVIHGRTGLLVPPGDLSAFVGAIEYISDNREVADEFGRMARKHVVEKFSLDRSALELESVYTKVIS
jgi:glycosyltransferase involved in cell wall biosynthesis